MQKANKDVEQGAFMRVLLNFSEHTFYRTTPGDYIWKDIYLFFWKISGKKHKNILGACFVRFCIKCFWKTCKLFPKHEVVKVRITAQTMKFSIKEFFSKVTKSARKCGFGHIYWINPLWKTSFFVQCMIRIIDGIKT